MWWFRILLPLYALILLRLPTHKARKAFYQILTELNWTELYSHTHTCSLSLFPCVARSFPPFLLCIANTNDWIRVRWILPKNNNYKRYSNRMIWSNFSNEKSRHCFRIRMSEYHSIVKKRIRHLLPITNPFHAHENQDFRQSFQSTTKMLHSNEYVHPYTCIMYSKIYIIHSRAHSVTLSLHWALSVCVCECVSIRMTMYSFLSISKITN